MTIISRGIEQINNGEENKSNESEFKKKKYNMIYYQIALPSGSK